MTLSKKFVLCFALVWLTWAGTRLVPVLSQTFLNKDGQPTGYGGYEHIGRAGQVRQTLCDIGDGGWPFQVQGKIEFYVDGAWQPEANCNVSCRVILFDADDDGAVTLWDYAEFQRMFGGP